jgi:DNA polymerase theta
MATHVRFYTALALNELANEEPLVSVADKYDFNKGYLQSLQQSSATYAGNVFIQFVSL